MLLNIPLRGVIQHRLHNRRGAKSYPIIEISHPRVTGIYSTSLANPVPRRASSATTAPETGAPLWRAVPVPEQQTKNGSELEAPKLLFISGAFPPFLCSPLDTATDQWALD
jgi:hypothetical protein